MAFDPRNLIRPVGPGLPGAMNPLAFIGAGMATGDMGSQLARMGQLQMTAQQVGMQQQEAERKRKQQEAMTAVAPGVAQQLYPGNTAMQQLMAANPQLLAQVVKAQSKPQDQWETLPPEKAAAMGFKPGSVVQKSATTGQLRVPGTGVNITNVPAPSAGYEYFQTPEGTLQARKVPGGPAEKPTEKQQDVAAYVQNAEAASNMLETIDKDVSPTQVAAAGNPITRLVTSDEAKRVHDAQLAWTWAVLRAESGAAVTREEAQNTMNIYFERPGDTEKNRKDKRKLRDTKERTMRERAASAIKSQESQEQTQPSPEEYGFLGYEDEE